PCRRSRFRVRRSVLGGVKMSTRSLSFLVPALVLAAGCVKSGTPAATPAANAGMESAAPVGGAPARGAAGHAAPAAAPPPPHTAARRGGEPMPPMPPWKHGENIFAGPKLA